MPADLPAEAALLALAQRWARAEAQVRQLLARATRGGDRRALLTQALVLLQGLRGDAQRAGPELERTYMAAFLAVGLLLDLPDVPAPEAARDQGRALAARLDRAAQTAEEGSRTAFATTTEDNLAQGAQDAVTGLVDRAGRRLALGGYVAGVTRQAGRVAVSTGTAAALGEDGLVTISSHGTQNPICVPLEGVTLPASGNLPPYHAGCQHVATPSGFTIGEHVDAMQEAVREVA
jgi:hypothetical protein